MAHDIVSDISPKPGDRIDDLSTPRPIIDEGRMAANIARVQSYMDAHGLNFRPHIKIAQDPALARERRTAGAEARSTARRSPRPKFLPSAGFEDILITFNIIGPEKLTRLSALNDRIAD